MSKGKIGQQLASTRIDGITVSRYSRTEELLVGLSTDILRVRSTYLVKKESMPIVSVAASTLLRLRYLSSTAMYVHYSYLTLNHPFKTGASPRQHTSEVDT